MPSFVLMIAMVGLLYQQCHSGATPTGPRKARPDDRLRVEPGISIKLPLDSGATRRGGSRNDVDRSHANQANVGIGRHRHTAPMITRMKNTSTTPCITANTGPDGGFPGATAVNAGTFRKAWMIRTN